MSESMRFPLDEAVPLRCELCNEQIGVVLGGSDEAKRVNESAQVVRRCFACAADEAASRILAEDSQ